MPQQATALWSDKIKEQIKIKNRKWKVYLSKKMQENYKEFKSKRIWTKELILSAKNQA